MTFGNKRFVKSHVNHEPAKAKDGHRSGYKVPSGYNGEHNGAKNELKLFIQILQITP